MLENLSIPRRAYRPRSPLTPDTAAVTPRPYKAYTDDNPQNHTLTTDPTRQVKRWRFVEKHQAHHGTCPRPRGNQQSQGDGVGPGSRSRVWSGPRPVPSSPQLQVTEFPTLNFRRTWCRAGQASGAARGPRRSGKAPRPERTGTRLAPSEGVCVPSSTAHRRPSPVTVHRGCCLRQKQEHSASEIADHARKEEKAVEICVYFSPGDLKKKKRKAVSWTTPALQLSIPLTPGLPQSLRTTDRQKRTTEQPQSQHPSAPERTRTPRTPAASSPAACPLPFRGTPSHAERTGKLPGSAEGSPGLGRALLRPAGTAEASGPPPAPPAPARTRLPRGAGPSRPAPAH